MLGFALFQFHMVRLKGLFARTQILIYGISIPYGAIKRRSTLSRFISQLNFNSIWCD